MESRQGLFFAVAVFLIAAGPLACRANFDEYGSMDVGMGMGSEYGGYNSAMAGSVHMSHQSHHSAPPQCTEVTTCTCNCVPKQQCTRLPLPPPPRPCPLGTTKSYNGNCVPIQHHKPQGCSICNICHECADEKISISVKTCLQMHSDNQNSLMCLQAAGVSSHSARNLVNARNSPGFMALLESGQTVTNYNRAQIGANLK